MKPVRFGLIGCGRVARYRAQAFMEIEGTYTVATREVLQECPEERSLMNW